MQGKTTIVKLLLTKVVFLNLQIKKGQNLEMPPNVINLAAIINLNLKRMKNNDSTQKLRLEDLATRLQLCHNSAMEFMDINIKGSKQKKNFDFVLGVVLDNSPYAVDIKEALNDFIQKLTEATMVEKYRIESL